MTAYRQADTYGYLGTEGLVLKELRKQLAAAIDKVAKAEGTEAVNIAGEAARDIRARAKVLADGISEQAEKAVAAAGEGRTHLANGIRERPLLAIAIAAAAGFALASLRRR